MLLGAKRQAWRSRVVRTLWVTLPLLCLLSQAGVGGVHVIFVWELRLSLLWNSRVFFWSEGCSNMNLRSTCSHYEQLPLTCWDLFSACWPSPSQFPTTVSIFISLGVKTSTGIKQSSKQWNSQRTPGDLKCFRWPRGCLPSGTWHFFSVCFLNLKGKRFFKTYYFYSSENFNL